MFVMYPRDPDRCQLGQTWRMPNEHVVVRQDKYVVCYKATTAKYLGRKGFLPVDLVNLRDISKELKLPVPVLNAWGRSGKITVFGSDTGDFIPSNQFDILKLEKESKTIDA